MTSHDILRPRETTGATGGENPSAFVVDARSRCPVTVRDLLYRGINYNHGSEGLLVVYFLSGDLARRLPSRWLDARVMTEILAILANEQWTTRPGHQIISSRKKMALRFTRVCHSLHMLTICIISHFRQIIFPGRTKVQLAIICFVTPLYMAPTGKSTFAI